VTTSLGAHLSSFTSSTANSDNRHLHPAPPTKTKTKTNAIAFSHLPHWSHHHGNAHLRCSEATNHIATTSLQHKCGLIRDAARFGLVTVIGSSGAWAYKQTAGNIPWLAHSNLDGDSHLLSS